MKIINAIVLALFLLTFSLQGIQAQSTLIINKKLGDQTLYTLTSVKSLTFADGLININKHDKSTDTYTLSDLQSLKFAQAGSTGVSSINTHDANKLLLYPNPVSDLLYIRYVSSNSAKVSIQIIDAKGCVVASINTEYQLGSNQLSIPLAQLQSGIYFCRVKAGNDIVISKFLKH